MKIRVARLTAIAGLAVLLAACGSGVDRKLPTQGDDTELRAAIDKAGKEMSEQDRAAYNWATSDLALADLRTRYPEGTPRDVIHGEARQVLDTYPKRIEELNDIAAALDTKRKALQAIVAMEPQLTEAKDVFGRSIPQVNVTVHNGTGLPVSSLAWKVQMYLDDEQTPALEEILYDTYDNGLAPDATVSRQLSPGSLFSNKWQTLAIRNAKTRRLVLAVDPYSVRDFNEKNYLDRDAADPTVEVKRRQETMAVAKKMATY